LTEGLQGGLVNRSPAIFPQMLPQVTDLHRSRSDDLASVHLLLAAQDLEQGGLARAVGPGQAYLVLIAQLEGKAIEQVAIAEGEGKLADVYHKNRAIKLA